MNVKPVYMTQERWKTFNSKKKVKVMPKCSICLQPIKKMTKWDRLHLGLSTVDVHIEFDSYTLTCKHCFHSDCIFKWFENSESCPNCRRIV